MSPRTKSILLLVATLVIGLLLGALLNGYLVRQRLDRLGSLMTPRGFAGRLEEAVQPTSEEQRSAIRDVLDGAAPRAMDIMRRSREDMRALSDSVKDELRSVLSEEQMSRLEEHMRFRRRGPWRGGPPMLRGDGPPRQGAERFDRPRRYARPDSAVVGADSVPPPPSRLPPPGE